MKLNLKAAKSLQKSEEARAGTGQHHLLLVDDEAFNLAGLERILSESYKVSTFTSAPEALAFIDKGGPEADFSAIVSDHIMPGMSGVEFLKELQKRQHPAPRIMLTGFAALDNVITAVNEASIFRYLTKPVPPEEIKRAVRDALAFYEMRQENSRLITMVKRLIERNAQLTKQLQHFEGDNPQTPTADKGTPPPRRHEVAILFADIRGFTKLTRQVEPELVIGALDTIFKPVHEIVYETGGVVDKHLGDGLMAIFGLTGAPILKQTLEATARIVEQTAKTLAVLEPPFDQLKVSFGLASGTAVLGQMGSIQKSELVLIGETANLAARLQEATKLALTTEEGRNVFGDFPRVMALCSPNMLEEQSVFRSIHFTGSMAIRDFPDIRTVGVFKA